ncbi:hypothetical protein YK48G_14900 [Lentilactobacillus fungorum]|uniref:Uncharacterized protein n=1 Tax=Lentilactobacillus fungorum TaxID=2201250 RepID=A0ABQ3VYS8_9LACO|nr:helveticin J family class III bacteriocin [Lentilactobacillus fungorum]GHP14065.1 hypothetical protein YK48G_14900 [Lentilactobacillus fungorum]
MTQVAAQLMYRLINLPKKTVVQKVYIGDQSVYALQLFNQNQDAIISRVKKPQRINGHNLDFRHAQHMTLKNFGHGQTLAYFCHQGIDYWWVVAEPNLSDYPDIKWGSQLARIRFEPDRRWWFHRQKRNLPTRLTMLDHTTPTGQSYGDLKRVEGALSPDKRTLLIAAVARDGSAHFSLYDHQKLNERLDQVAAVGGAVDLSQAGQLLSSSVANPYIVVPAFTRRLTSPSIQGVALSDTFTIFVSSGQAAVNDQHPQADQPAINQFQWGSDTAKPLWLNNPAWINQNIETEGVQLGDRLYVGVAFHDAVPYATKTVANCVYWVEK